MKEKNILKQEMPYKDITSELKKIATPNDNVIPVISKYLKYNLKNASFDMKDITNIERITLKQIQNKINIIITFYYLFSLSLHIYLLPENF